MTLPFSRPWPAALWLLLVVAALLHVGFAMARGLPLQSDIMALLPREDRDAAVQQAKDTISVTLSHHVLFLLGHTDPAQARAAADRLEQALTGAGMMSAATDIPSATAIQQIGRRYFPERGGLLADADRRRLLDGRGSDLASRALSQIFGFAGFADGRMLAADPFQLLPAFLAGLPLPTNKLHLDNGRLTATGNGLTWVLVSGQLTGEATSLAFQKRFTGMVDAVGNSFPRGVRLLRLSALFYAQAGADRAITVSSTLALISLAGTALLLLAAFRSVIPLALGLLSIAVGFVVALSLSLLVFGELHVAAQLFGVSLIGIAADYALLYFAQLFSGQPNPQKRLAKVFTGITLGMLTTVVGYLSLALSPFPGLHQVALFSAVGLFAAYLTVLLWLPRLDRLRPIALGRRAVRWAEMLGAFWLAPVMRRWRWASVVLACLIGLAGYRQIHIDDDVRHQQTLDPQLSAEQSDIQRLIGFAPTGQFFLVSAVDDEQALRDEEILGVRLADLVVTGALSFWNAPARFIPSLERQFANRRLIDEQLIAPHFAALRKTLGMAAVAPLPEPSGTLTLPAVMAEGGFPILNVMVLQPGRHLVLLEGITDMAAVRHAADGIPGVRFVDPTLDISALLAAYRVRALWLLAVSVLLMAPLVAWRYGWRGIPLVLGPPALAVIMAPACLGLAGIPFTFFSAIGLVLSLSIGVDYAVFCAEDERLNPVTLTGITLAMSTAILSFGLLAASDIEGIQTFGAAMLVSVPLSYAMAPLAGRAQKRQSF